MQQNMGKLTANLPNEEFHPLHGQLTIKNMELGSQGYSRANVGISQSTSSEQKPI